MTCPTPSARCCSRRFGCGRTAMHRCAAPPRCLSVIPTPCAIACAASSDAPADLSRAQKMSPNFVWLWKCADGSCNQVDFGDYTDARAALYRTTTPEIAVRAKVDCGTTPSFNRDSKGYRDRVVGIGDWCVVPRGGGESDCHRSVSACSGDH